MYRLLSLFLLGLSCMGLNAQNHPGHSHNDYEQIRPLEAALDNGFRSVEVDIFIHKGRVVVSHIPLGLRLKGDIETLYFKPLQERIRRNGGTVYSNDSTTFIIYLDCKNGGNHWTELRKIMDRYKEMFMKWEGDKVVEWGPVEILIDGRENEVLAESPRWANIQKGLGEYANQLSAVIQPRLNGPLRSVIKWKGNTDISMEDSLALQAVIDSAHAKGRGLRLYAATNKIKVWKTLLDMGVDWINVDQLGKFNRFYEKYRLDAGKKEE